MTLAFGAPHDLVGAFEAMKSSGDVEVAQVKNKFANPTPLGYRDMNTCVCVDLGADEDGKKHIAEVQLNLSEMLTAKKRAHVHYEKIRTVIGDACKDLSDDVGEKLQEFIVSKLSSSALDAAVAKLVGKAGGLMVYAKLLHDQLKLEKETNGAVDFGKLATLPQGLDEMYQANFGRVFGDVVKKGLARRQAYRGDDYRCGRTAASVAFAVGACGGCLYKHPRDENVDLVSYAERRARARDAQERGRLAEETWACIFN